MDKASAAVVIDRIQESCELLGAMHVTVAYPLLPVKAYLKTLFSKKN